MALFLAFNRVGCIVLISASFFSGLYGCSGAQFAGISGDKSKEGATKEETSEQPVDVAGGFGLTCTSGENSQVPSSYDFNCDTFDKNGKKFWTRSDVKIDPVVKVVDQVVKVEVQAENSPSSFKFTVDKSDVENVSITVTLTNPEDGNKLLAENTSPLVSVWTATFFMTQWDTRLDARSNESTIYLPLIARGVYDFIVDWGDGKSDVIKSWDDPAKVHQYSGHGSYKVVIRGKIFGFSMHGSPTAGKLVDIMQFGRLRLENGDFAGARNLKISASDQLDLTGTTNMTKTFSGCSSLTTAPSLAKWDTSKVTQMAAMFEGATNFNENISAWDVRNVTNMDYMFQDANAFNQPIGSWNVSKVTTMRSMFQRATSFTNDLSSWNVGSVVYMDLMFDNSGLSASMPPWFR